ncbi:BTAD domain-containing putative transcriptional regulator [Amycolatopsis sp. NPDC059090]|uniref:AfsR/SARP family transcriptional regulator n=1 Tax=unclassified Amycolatopsis TaxID=2618356 RepID=UPI00366DCBCD
MGGCVFEGAMVRFGVLGPLVALDDDRQLALGGAKQQKVLAALLMARGRVVPLEHLVDAVWEAEPPASAEKQVRNAVSNLRQVLSRHERTIESATGGYALAVGQQLDAAAFESKLSRARSLATAGNTNDAVAEYRAALGFWRGPALAGLDCPALAPQVAGLEEQRLITYEECVELTLSLGRHRQLVEELRRWAEANPLRERLTAQLMVALHRSGSSAQAALAYERLENTLRGELGIEPRRELRQLYERITGNSSGPRPSRWIPRNDLPRDVSCFTGRHLEFERLVSHSSALRSSASTIFAINGMAGVGKTTLAVHAAHRLAGMFPDAQLFLDLHAHTPGRAPMSPSSALEKLFEAIGLGNERIPDDLEARAARWRAQLARRRVLLVLDNAAATAQIRPLLPGSPRCLVLVTSRRRLTDLDAGLVPLDVMPVTDAWNLFANIVGTERALAEPEETEQVLRLCGFLPLAIQIAGARLRHRRSWSVSHLASRLSDEHQRLQELETDNFSVAAAFSLSYEHLAADEKVAFRRLGLVPGADIEPRTAGALLGCAPEDAENKLENLVDGHLVQQHAPSRYSLHDLLRTYAAEMAARTDTETVRRAALTRLFDHCLSTASEAMDVIAPAEQAHRPRRADSTSATANFSNYEHALGWLNAERANLVAMSRHAVSHDWLTHASHLSSTLSRYFHISGNHSDALVLHTNALAAASATGNASFEADALASRGYINWRLGRYQFALADCRSAVRIAAELGNRNLEGRALHALGLVYSRLGSANEALEVLRRTLAAGRETGDKILEGYALRTLGEVNLRLGKQEDAIVSYEKALAVARASDNGTVECCALRALGEIYTRANRLGEAMTHSMRALDLARRSRNRNVENRALRTLGEIYRRLGERDESSRRFEEALRVSKETSNPFEEACAHEGAAQTRYEQGDPRSAAVHWRRAMELFDDLGVPEGDRVRVRLRISPSAL